MDLAAFEYLLTDAGQRLMSEAMSSYDASNAPDATNTLTLTQRLRAFDGGRSSEQVAAALTQARLRRAATSKFGPQAEQIYLTPAGLEQSTHPVVAAHRAMRMSAGGGGAVLDLGCGIGSDLIAFARAGFQVTGVDSDVLTARVAEANLAALALSGTVRTATADEVAREPFDVVFADPSRRQGATRVFDPKSFSPPWDFVLGLLAGAADSATRQRVAVKLAPGLDHALVPPYAEAEWVSLNGQLKEAVLWSPAPTVARARATVLGLDGTAASCTDTTAPEEAPEVGEVGGYLYEPDPAVIRAHLVSTVAAEVAGWLLDKHIAYVSSDIRSRSALARCFRVIETLPFKEKPLRAALRARNVGALTIKKRGVAVTPEELRKKLALRGDQAATIILTRTPRSAVALLVEPLD